MSIKPRTRHTHRVPGYCVSSARCTTCHSMDTPAKIEQRHNGLVSAASVVQAASLFQAGESVLHCQNCHEDQFTYILNGIPFGENRWATPTVQQDIGWGQIMTDFPGDWPSQICNRMVTRLPTHAARQAHFHEDARLFWAVASGELPDGNPTLPTAPPHDDVQFIDDFDAWNDSGAPCP